MSTGTDQPWLTAQDVSNVLHIHIDDVYRLMASGEIPARKFGRRWRVPPGELEKLGGITPPARRTRERLPEAEVQEQPQRPRRRTSTRSDAKLDPNRKVSAAEALGWRQ